MSRGEKKEGVRQGRPFKKAVAPPDILWEADRIIKERLHEIEKGKGCYPFLLGLLLGLSVPLLFLLISTWVG